MKLFLLPQDAALPDAMKERLDHHYESGGLRDPKADIAEIFAEDFNLDVRARYGPIEIAHPIGKASGQLSLQPAQVEADAEAGMAFVVLKTVIAEDERGTATMQAWKVRKPRMDVEPIEGKTSGRKGWTVSWAGRGWEGSLDSYLDFTKQALRIGEDARMPVIPSCKYHLPSSPEVPFRHEEYDFTTRRIAEAWREIIKTRPLVLELDFSPTLAGTDAAQSQRLILNWLEETPSLIKKAEPNTILGVKLMNALFDDAFQLEMLRVVSRYSSPIDFLVCFNRLFDPERIFGEGKGIAYGGPDLSERNLRIMESALTPDLLARRLPISATGDICTGAMMVEYALRGASSGQVHTFFQLPPHQYALRGVSRSRAALHELYFHPRHGMAAAMLALRERYFPTGETLRFLDLPRLAQKAIFPR